jgi:hypothetical protein
MPSLRRKTNRKLFCNSQEKIYFGYLELENCKRNIYLPLKLMRITELMTRGGEGRRLERYEGLGATQCTHSLVR